ncbi:MAG: TrmB family transcriptional regulator [Candidatus Hodarchaeales archaeon]
MVNKPDIDRSSQAFPDLKLQIKSLFDLSESEVKVYMQLLANDKLTATRISEITDIQRTRTYEIFRNLREKELIELISENPQKYSVVSPRIAIDNWLLKSQRRLEKKKTTLMKILPSIQQIWNSQHEDFISNRISFISEDLVREIIPHEIKNARKEIYLALKDPTSRTSTHKGHAGRLFDPLMFNEGIQDFLQRGVKLHILLGKSDQFIGRAHPVLLKTLINGLIDETIEVKSLNEHFPQSFLLVDKERVYLFFLEEFSSSMKEALRAESQSLTEFFSLVWSKLWNDAIPIDLESVIQALNEKS